MSALRVTGIHVIEMVADLKYSCWQSSDRDGTISLSRLRRPESYTTDKIRFDMTSLLLVPNHQDEPGRTALIP